MLVGRAVRHPVHQSIHQGDPYDKPKAFNSKENGSQFHGGKVARPRTSGYQHYAEAFEHYERQPVGRFPGQVQQASAHERAAKEGWSNDIRLVMGPEQADQGAEAERRKEQIFARMMAMPPCLKCKTQNTQFCKHRRREALDARDNDSRRRVALADAESRQQVGVKRVSVPGSREDEPLVVPVTPRQRSVVIRSGKEQGAARGIEKGLHKCGKCGKNRTPKKPRHVVANVN